MQLEEQFAKKLQVVEEEVQGNETHFIIKFEQAYKCSSEAWERRRRRLIVTCYSIREYCPPNKVGFCFRTRRKKQKGGIVDPWEILELVSNYKKSRLSVFLVFLIPSRLA